ncbi:MAG: 16S rRNA (cytosine(1402)-N(4))-methyltransferase RsmH [Alphaproteobacteria bacterium]
MMPHAPVMKDEMLEMLAPKDNGTYIDGTFGAGGYSHAILSSADCRVFAIDRDPSTREFAKKLEAEFPSRFVWLLGNFADMCSLAAAHGVTEADGIVLDLGVSSMQIDQPGRGFSFKNDGPLDMRMSQQGMSAADIINNAPEQELADILYYYGEETAARRIARAIVETRADEKITGTRQLADIIRKTIGNSGKTDPATRSFQALRIHVNQELESIEGGLKAAESMLAPGGRLVVVSFHSLEDRLTKRFFYSRCGRLGEQSRHMPTKHEVPAASRFFMPKPEKRVASEAEIARNPRSRSATLRTMGREVETTHP